MIVLIRHGQTTSNAQGLLVGRSDPELTERGERQALALRPYLANVSEVWTSPLSRARRTAQIALPALSAVVKESFIELDYGELEGEPMSSLSAQQWRALETDHEMPLGNAESLASVDARVHQELDSLMGDASSLLHDPEHDLAVVSHVAPIKSSVIWALGVPGSVVWRTRLDNGSITTIGARRARPLLVHFNLVPISL